MIKYMTSFTRKSGDANTSTGNSSINLAATYSSYKETGVFDNLILCLILGDDNISIFSRKSAVMHIREIDDILLREELRKEYAKFGLDTKIKTSNHIA